MDLRHLRYFCTVAARGSILGAAEELGIAQPPLSMQIKQFERELGVPLFRRMSRGVQLTAEGEALLEPARAILDLQRQFVDLARGLRRGDRGTVRVGLAGAVALLPAVPTTIKIFRERLPGAKVTMEESNTPALADALRERILDAAIIRPPMPDPHGLRVYPLVSEPTRIALPAGHRLSGRKKIKLSELANETLIIFPRALGPGFHDAILSACKTSGFTPIIDQEAPQIAAMVPMVAAGLGFSIVPKSLTQIHTEGVSFHQIASFAPTADLALAIRSQSLPPLVMRFVATFLEDFVHLASTD
ncbi:LysR family transcriptional regulator [Paraburkholderia sp. XV]|uniref:LysR family transcriptional regulator n=1 Tax=Paraburkholderia sp. XV TaxID=2831520 RepID=UPI001CD4CFF1|nr:LysR family transcriptional regulator [Paraburkholderia sp. XV]